jgi:hypothetical protein
MRWVPARFAAIMGNDRIALDAAAAGDRLAADAHVRHALPIRIDPT